MNQLTTNTFNDGLNTDLNALVTPNTVLTNALNATLITFNGNEQVLQNDMGNGKVEDAFLPKGYVPVGMKEHGGIIYVASYNPEEKTSLIGCFPSPELTFENQKTGSKASIAPIKANLQVKVFEDDLTLKPGNRFIISIPEYGGTLLDDINFNWYVDTPPRKRRYSVDLYLMTASGLLEKITDLCYNSTMTSNWRFFITSDPIPENTVYQVYKGNLSGVPYIQVIENLATNMDVAITTGKEELSDGYYKVSFNIEVNVHFDCLCVDFGDGKGLNGIIVKINNTEYTLKEVKETVTTPSSDGLYSIKYAGIITTEQTFPETTTLELELYPSYTYGDVTNNISYTHSYLVANIGSGKHFMRYWKYFYDSTFITITWGLESYPDYNGVPLNVELQFFLIKDTISTDPDLIYPLDTLVSYDGMFTTLISSSLLEEGCPYIVMILWEIPTTKDGVSKTLLYRSFRWLITTDIYNDYYQEVDDYFVDMLKGEDATILNLAALPYLDLDYEIKEEVDAQEWSDVEPISTSKLAKESTKTTTYKYSIESPTLGVNSADVNYPFTWSIEEFHLKECTGVIAPTIPDTKFEDNTMICSCSDNLSKTTDGYNKATNDYSEAVEYTYTVKYKCNYIDIPEDGVTINNTYQTYAVREKNNNLYKQVLIGCDFVHHGAATGRDDHYICMDCYEKEGSNTAQGITVNHQLDTKHLDSDFKANLKDYKDEFENYARSLMGDLMYVGFVGSYGELYKNSTRITNLDGIIFNILINTGDGLIFYYNKCKLYNKKSNEWKYNGGPDGFWGIGTYIECANKFTDWFSSWKPINFLYTSNKCLFSNGESILTKENNVYLAKNVDNLQVTDFTSTPTFAVNIYALLKMLYMDKPYNETVLTFTSGLISNLSLYNESNTELKLELNVTNIESIKNLKKIDTAIYEQLGFKVYNEEGELIEENGSNYTNTATLIFTNEIPVGHNITGNSDIISKVDKFEEDGIDSVVEYLGSSNQIVRAFVSQQLNPDAVYKLEYNTNKTIKSILLLSDLAIMNFNGLRHVVLLGTRSLEEYEIREGNCYLKINGSATGYTTKDW